jgi:hypothetical protein
MKNWWLALSGAVLLLSACTPEGSWDQILRHQELADKGLIWERRVPIDIDNTTGAVDLQDIPLPIRLTASSFDLDSTAAGGVDLRCTAADGVTDLPHEVESWREPPTGDSLVWVKVPFIAANSPATRIWLYYKNRNPRPEKNAAAVWTDSYEAVWHLGDDPATGAFHDSTGNGRDGSVPGGGYTAPAPAPAAYGAGALYSTPNTTGFSVPAGSAPSLTGPVTVTLWARDSGCPSGARVMTTGPVTLWLSGGSPPAKLKVEVSRTGTNLLKEFVNPLPAGFHRLDITWTGALLAGDVSFYRDGVLQTLVASVNDGSGARVSDSGQALFVGNSTTPNRAFIGILDEVRIASVVRSPAWIESQYRLGAPGAMTIGAAEDVHY